jgi:hypothetical protein
MRESAKIQGVLRWAVQDSEGCVIQSGENHNIVTSQGDALIADALSSSPARLKVDNTNGVIGVGTGFAVAGKSTAGLTTQTGSDEPMDATYPKLKANWGTAGDNVVQFRSTFEAGKLNASGINEAALGNGTDNLAYAEITPTVNVGVADTLRIDWEITFLGA